MGKKLRESWVLLAGPDFLMLMSASETTQIYYQVLEEARKEIENNFSSWEMRRVPTMQLQNDPSMHP